MAMAKPLGCQGREGWGPPCVTHPDELVVALITKLLEHMLGLGQPFPSALGLLQLHLQGGH